MSAADPAKTYAVVVGIGVYAIDHSWKLPNAAKHAVQFAAWLRRRNVPADNIFLFLAEPDRLAFTEEFHDAGLRPAYAATSNEMDGFFKSEKFQELTGDYLVHFWAGHGSVTDADERHLFYSDVRAGLVPALDFKDHLLRLRSRPLGKFPMQHAYVDSCANRFADLELKTALSTSKVGVDGVVGGIDQRAIFAADSGLEAIAGRFSERILSELQAPANVSLWPPDSDAIAAAILADAELTGQHPQQFWIRTYGRERAEISGELPASESVNVAAAVAGCSVSWLRGLASVTAHLPAFADARKEARSELYCYALDQASDDRGYRLSPRDDLLESIAFAYARGREQFLRDAIAGLEKRVFEFDSEFARVNLLRDARLLISSFNFDRPTLTAVYAAATTLLPRREMNSEVLPLGTMLYELSQTDFGEELYRRRSLFEFIVRLAQVHELSADDRELLRDFVRTQASQRMLDDIERQLLGERRFLLGFAVDQDEPDGPLGLAAQLMTENFAPIKTYPHASHSTVDDLKVGVNAIVLDVRLYLRHQRRLEDDVLDIEFLLPLDLIGLAPDDFPISLKPITSLGDLYPVVVRWRERYDAPELCKTAEWKLISDSIPRDKAIAPIWLKREHFGENRPPVRHSSVLGLAFLAEEEVRVLVEEGAPFVVWPRFKPRCGFSTMRLHINRWARTHPAGDLRRRVKTLRSDHFEASRGVSIFWDDPKREYRFFHDDVYLGDEGG